MPLTEEQKKAKKEELREQLIKLREDTLSRWRHLFTADVAFRNACGYVKGPEDMIQQLVKDYDKKLSNLMKPFDRGDYD